MYRREINKYIKQNYAPRDYLRDCTGMHGQQNIKFSHLRYIKHYTKDQSFSSPLLSSFEHGGSDGKTSLPANFCCHITSLVRVMLLHSTTCQAVQYLATRKSQLRIKYRREHTISQPTTSLPQFNTGTRRITTFRPTTDRIYDGGPKG